MLNREIIVEKPLNEVYKDLLKLTYNKDDIAKQVKIFWGKTEINSFLYSREGNALASFCPSIKGELVKKIIQKQL
jgi:hypothetical protein